MAACRMIHTDGHAWHTGKPLALTTGLCRLKLVTQTDRISSFANGGIYPHLLCAPAPLLQMKQPDSSSSAQGRCTLFSLRCHVHSVPVLTPIHMDVGRGRGYHLSMEI